MKKICLFLPCLLLFGFSIFAQGTGSIQGKILDENGGPLIAATVLIKGTTTGTTADIDGSYILAEVPVGEQTVVVSFIGFSTVEKAVTIRAGETSTLDVTMGEDALQMDEVLVTGAADSRTKLESSVAITTLDPKVIEQRNPKGTGELISAVPGTFVDNSAGEVNAKIYARGLSSGLRTQPGYHYVMLQEDGLPVISTQFQFNNVDMYHRPDATVAKFEAIRGGSASISSANAPGGIFNFISKEGGDKMAGQAKFQTGLQGNNRSFFRTDLNLSGPLKGKWYYNTGGFYRLDQGARDLPYLANVGGQFKANVVRKHDKGALKFMAKVLNDKVSQYEFIPVNNLTDIQPLNDFSLQTSTIYPEVQAMGLPDGELLMQDSTATRDFDSNLGTKVNNYTFGINFLQEIMGGWIVKNNAKYSLSKLQYSQYAGNIVFNPESGLADFFQLPTAFFPNFTYQDLETGEVLYNKAAGIEEIDHIWAAAGFTVKNQVHDFIEQLSVSKEIKNHQLSFGVYGSHARADIDWTAEAIATTLEANPRKLYITHPESALFGTDTFDFSHPVTGLIAEGASVYNRAKGNSSTFSLFFSDLWEINDKLNVDAGVRFENVFHKGQIERYIPATDFYGFEILGFGLGYPKGVDGDYLTFYDSATKIGSGVFDNFKFHYGYVSGSFGLNYKFNEGLAVYGRGSIGNKAPELGYYVSNFTNQAVNRGFVEKIYMGEGGIKLRSRKGSIFLTGFYSRMNDVSFQLLVPGQGGIVIFTPSTFNTIQTIGTELEVVLYPVKGLNARMVFTAQDPRFVKFDYYNLAGTANPVFIDPQTGEPDLHPSSIENPAVSPYGDAQGQLVLAGTPSDDFLEKFDGNKLSNVPRLIADMTVSYKYNRFTVFTNCRYTGKRFANRRNTLTMPGFAQFNAGIDGKITKEVSASLKVSNLFNAAGIMNFDGLGFIGQSSDDLTEESIEANATAEVPNPYFVRPVLPRIVTASLSYEF